MFKNMIEFDTLLDRIGDCVSFYEYNRLNSCRYKLQLSNGEDIEIDYNLNCLPHLLGVNIEYLRSTGLYKGNAYDILSEILNNRNFLYGQLKSNNIKKDNIFSKHIDKKLNSFRKICGINIYNIEFVCEYNGENSYITGEEKLDGQYYIAFNNKAPNSSINVVGFAKDDYGRYIPMTNLELSDYVETREFFTRLLKRQNLTTVLGMQRNSFDEYGKIDRRRFYYDIPDKLRKMSSLERYSENYDCSISTNKDCMFYVEKTMNLYEEKNNIFHILNAVSDNIQNGKFINISDLEKEFGELKTGLVNLIGAHNDSINNNNNNNHNDENDDSPKYKDLILELRESKDEIKRLNDLIAKLDDNNRIIVNSNSKLRDENDGFKEREEKILQVLKSKK